MTTYVNNSSIRIINSQKLTLLTADNRNVITDMYNVYTIYTILIILIMISSSNLFKKISNTYFSFMTSKASQDNKLGMSNLDSHKSDFTQQIAHKIISSL